MSAHDISRHLFQPDNHYTGTRMQQGRVLLDSDINEARMLDEEAQRALVVDVVGPHGSPDSGFAIAGVTTNVYDFQILAGTYYLGGYRHEIAGAQTFRAQTDWRQSKRDDVVAALVPSLPAGPRHDLVYLVGWDQGVSAVEDSELHDPAIPAHDTGYRICRKHRVYVLKDSPADCAGAFEALVAQLIAGGHEFDRVNFELKSAARLASRLNPDPTSADLCRPAALQGFSGAEHQAIRIQLVAPDRFIWGLDNASALHRIKVEVVLGVTTVVLTTPPRDAAHQPRVGQILEILPQGSALPNGEFTADHPIAPGVGGGVLARVVTPYDPSTGTLTVAPEDPDKLGELLEWFVDETISMNKRYLFGRLWNPGDDNGAGPLGVEFDLEEIIRLQGTDYEVKFSAFGIVGDHWILGARPSTSRPIVPWELHDSGAPHGPRRFYSPLAIIHWSLDEENALQAEVHSCRRTFRPLTRLRGCCTVTVGDERTSFGDFTSINEALRAIPLDEAGRVCVLPGEYHERVILEDRNNIVIEGCGARTVLRTPAGSATSAGLITITRCTNITVRDLTIEAVGQFGVMIQGASTPTAVYCRELLLERLRITTRRDPSLPAPALDELWIPPGPAPFPLSTIAAYYATQMKVLDCDLTMVGDLSGAANIIFNDASYALVRGCRISTPAPPGTVSRAWGGVQLSSGMHVTLERNEIVGGLGHGVTLGSVYYADVPPSGYTVYFDTAGRLVIADDEDCPNVGGDLPLTALPPGGGTAKAVRMVHAPSQCTIVGNRIQQMGGSGLAVLGFSPAQQDNPLDPVTLIYASDLVVADNIIEGNCLRPAHASPPEGMLDDVAAGGVVLAMADRLRIRDNVIRYNGLDHRYPVCGIFVAHGEDVGIQDNLVIHNGLRVAAGAALAGVRAGISLQFVGRRVFASSIEEIDLGPETFVPAARVCGNRVDQPAGRALEVYGLGAMFIEGNTLVSRGLVGGPPVNSGHCVEIQNIGQSSEIAIQEAVPAMLGFLPAPQLPAVQLPIGEDYLDGRILFTDNQVHFAPVAEAAADVRCAVRLLSYGDVAVLGNQFVTTFPGLVGSMVVDTLVTAWSTRTNHNRWDDPSALVTAGVYQTDLSAATLARMNFTTLNEASRCIQVDISPNSPTIANNPHSINLVPPVCDLTPQFAELLAPPPPPPVP